MNSQDHSSEDPAFSIIVPVFNSQQYIEECVKSVLNQSYDDYELIIVDDGSTDGSLKICRALQRKHEKKIRLITQSNWGPYEARKVGMRHSEGKYLLFLDSDDVLRNDALLILRNTLKVHPVDLLVFHLTSRADFVADRSTLYFSLPGLSQDSKIAVEDCRRELIQSDRFNNLATKAVARHCCEDLMRETTVSRIVMGEDKLALACILSRVKSCFIINEALYYYRPNVESTTKSEFNIRRMLDLCTVHDRMQHFVNQWNCEYLSSQQWSLWLSQLATEVAELARSRMKYQEKVRFCRRLRDINLFDEAIEGADFNVMRIDRRLLIHGLRREKFASVVVASRIFDYLLVVPRWLKSQIAKLRSKLLRIV